MAEVVRNALQQETHAIIEAGTGIGKSFAYLIPILWSQTPAIISTSNKALMAQLWENDIPRLRQIAPHPFSAALLKGFSNYICAKRLQEFRQQPTLWMSNNPIQFIDTTLQQVPSGDIEEMRLPPALVERLTISGRDCEGEKCRHRGSCFYERAKADAQSAALVITNHALLCASIFHTEDNLLPIRHVLVIDEAHQLLAYAINTLTLSLEHESFWNIVGNGKTAQALKHVDDLDEARENYKQFFEAVARQDPQSRYAPFIEPVSPSADDEFLNKWALKGDFQEAVALWDVFKRIARDLEAQAAGLKDSGELDALARQSRELADAALALAHPEPPDHIRYCELDAQIPPSEPRAYHVQNRPLEVTVNLQQRLFDHWPRVICTSATLGINQSLDWFQRQVGAASCNRPVQSLLLDSPFDYRHQMLIYTPPNIRPRYGKQEEPDYVQQLEAEVERLLETSQGRALVLCTSRRRMEALYTSLAPRFDPRFPCFRQGMAPPAEIVERFKQDGHAIIFATRSFWEGVDIPGDALALVILDKIPFILANDPILKRHEQLLKSRQRDAFDELQVGQAILALRQGAGRLIRSETDWGVIAVLDSRILKASYGLKIRRSLPDGCHTTSFQDVLDFFQGTAGSTAPAPSLALPSGMHPAPIAALRTLIAQHGLTLIADPRRCRALLNDLCGAHKREINILITAQEERIPTALLQASTNVPAALLNAQLAQRLINQHAMNPDAARWVVEAWAAALSSAPTPSAPPQFTTSTRIP